MDSNSDPHRRSRVLCLYEKQQPGRIPGPYADGHSNSYAHDNTKKYTSQTLNFSFEYPSDWTVKEGNDYPGSAQGNDYIKITKGTDLIYASAKRDCLENNTYCKSVIDPQYPNGWPSFSTQSNNIEVKSIIDGIVKSTIRLR